jgi:hypothetical protein
MLGSSFLFYLGLGVSPDGPLLGSRPFDVITGKYGPYEWQTYSKVNERIHQFGSGMTRLYHNAMGLPSDSPTPQQWSFGLWAINRAEWTIASEAGSAFNLISVGLYDTLGPEAVVYGVNHSECTVVIASGKLLFFPSYSLITEISVRILQRNNNRVLQLYYRFDQLIILPICSKMQTRCPDSRSSLAWTHSWKQ